MIKNKRGITLIALIVTIIVLLILAGISIAMLTGDNGIFSMAKEAKTKNEEAEAREKLEIELTNFVAEKNTNKEYNENEYIDNKLEEKGMTVIEDIVLVDGWQFQIDRNIPKILKSIGKENIIKYEWEKLIKEGKTADEIVNNVELLNRVLEKEEDIEYIFYDTLKTDTDNIGNGEELKKTATILSNIAQKFHVFIASSLQLLESSTLPVNLTINDMSASKTVKEVLDTLCLIKQINNQTLSKYEYSFTEEYEKCFEIEKFTDPDIRYYACVVDKNRAGAKPKVLFKLNLAYNSWEELGYLRLKQEFETM